ncbi:MAG: hypothetical protein A3K83_07290 [Omnitrophica WOR_2 bacterium RBG_13_44_8b]|nr:MAG: hypothetical protein A3K83_07290 [Omnitrophica WOR_2 bacterium RBG_13_44_8b]
MSLKKNLKTGQAALEYFILFALIGTLTILSVSTFFRDAANAGMGWGGLQQRAMEKILFP